VNIDAIPTARAPTSSLGHRGRGLITAPAAAGIAYATAWVLGLAVWPSNLDVAASNVKVFDLINRIDGVKMLALAAMAVAGFGLVRRAVLPRWLGYAAAFLTVALIASGAGYLLLNTELAQAAYVSGPLLLVWVTGAGIAVAGTHRSMAAA
jgi:hypothetical protein